MDKQQEDNLLRQAFSYRDDMVAYAYALTRDWSLAQDAFQEALITLHHKIDEMKVETLFYWLKRVTRNKAVDIIRKYEVMSKAKEKLVLLVDTCFDHHFNEDYREQKSIETKALYSCMQKLRVDARELLLGYYRDRLSCIELANTFQRSENALRLLLSRSRSSLKSCIKNKINSAEQ